MNNTTDTNQASEDELMRELRLLYGRRVSSNLSLAEYFLEMRQLIRTEKLKLLAEVRERVVGEDERIDIQSDYDKLDVPHLETDKYPGLDGVRQASRNLCRKRQRAALTKLEAEL